MWPSTGMTPCNRSTGDSTRSHCIKAMVHDVQVSLQQPTAAKLWPAMHAHCQSYAGHHTLGIQVPQPQHCMHPARGTCYVTDLCWKLCRVKHHGHDNAVHLNDVFFAGHAAVLAALTLAQCFIYERGNQQVSRLCASAILCATIAALVSFGLVVFDSTRFPMLTFLYYLSWVKMGVTFFKYMPQVCTPQNS